jgi:Protein of unknown function (DUF3800)
MNKNNKHIVYIDESGILSKKGHSAYVCLYVEYKNQDLINKDVLKIEEDLKIQYSHWVDMSWKIRVKFTENIKNLDFDCRIVIYKNPINQKNILKNFIIKVIDSKDNISKIIIDGSQGRKYERELKSFLKKYNIKVYKIKFKDDKDEPSIRLADFSAGLYRSYLDNKNEDVKYMYDLLKHKIKISN